MSAIERYVAFYETLAPESLSDLRDLVSEDVTFSDPFNSVTGPEAVLSIFGDMFERVEHPRFQIHDIAESRGREGCFFLRWTMTMGDKTQAREISGMSEVQVDGEGLISAHVDYWDPARQLYEHVPVLGTLMRAVRRRLEVTS